MVCSPAAKTNGELVRGFSLIELLTVVAILSTLAALLFPVVSAAKRSGMGSSCLSNLRQAGSALAMYSDDHAGVLPEHNLLAEAFQYTYAEQFVHRSYCLCASRPAVDRYCWLDDIHSYLRLTNLFCPADRGDDRSRYSTSYEYKLDLAYDGDLARLIVPSKVAVLWEQWAFHQAGRESSRDDRATLNVLFADGSTKYKKLSRTTTAVFGDGPDLMFLFPGVGEDRAYEGEDFVD
jgi:prepilin-type N-terminal cleavage/methylation domain-containing protein/prepilin-type processing-associated H-X9-DG protein